MPPAPPPWITALLGGTLASSCCLVQLALNAAGVGCAGFAALDRWRAPALVAGAASLAAAHVRSRSVRSTVTWFAVMVLLAASREWTAAFGRAGGTRGLASARGAPPSSTLAFTLTGVKCAACGERARAAAAAAAGPGGAASVEWERGVVRVVGDGVAERAAEVRSALEEAGFGVAGGRDEL